MKKAKITTLEKMIDLSPSAWESMDFKDIHTDEYMADHLCQSYAFIAAYLGARGADGFGDSGHEKAIQAGIKAKKKIRKSLGYTHP